MAYRTPHLVEQQHAEHRIAQAVQHRRNNRWVLRLRGALLEGESDRPGACSEDDA